MMAWTDLPRRNNFSANPLCNEVFKSREKVFVCVFTASVHLDVPGLWIVFDLRLPFPQLFQQAKNRKILVSILIVGKERYIDKPCPCVRAPSICWSNPSLNWTFDPGWGRAKYAWVLILVPSYFSSACFCWHFSSSLLLTLTWLFKKYYTEIIVFFLLF